MRQTLSETAHLQQRLIALQRQQAQLNFCLLLVVVLVVLVTPAAQHQAVVVVVVAVLFMTPMSR
jgi:hypothetical protein